MAAPDFGRVSLADMSALDAFALRAQAELRTAVRPFVYPETLRKRGNADAWKSHVPAIRQANRDTLDRVTGKAGVYAIFTAKKREDWQLKHIGQTTAGGSRQRICSHLVWRNKETPSGRFTGSKFDDIQAALRWRQDVAFSFVEIDPAALRHYVEWTLIDRKNPEWNPQGTTLIRQQISARHCCL